MEIMWINNGFGSSTRILIGANVIDCAQIMVGRKGCVTLSVLKWNSWY